MKNGNRHFKLEAKNRETFGDPESTILKSDCIFMVYAGGEPAFLGSSTKLPSAVDLYESLGFRHVQPEMLTPMPYARANVFIEMAL